MSIETLRSLSPSGAIFSPCKTYRYALWRIWNVSDRLLLYIMLNGSTAGAHKDDPTVRRVAGFTRRFGYGGFMVGNLFGFCTQDPDELFAEEKAGLDIVGPENDAYLIEMASRTHGIVFAWGANARRGGRLHARAQEIRSLFTNAHSIGPLKNGNPPHPLYLPKELDMQKINWPDWLNH